MRSEAIVWAALVSAMAATQPAAAEANDAGWVRFDEGWWRLEVSAMPEGRGDPADRDGDYAVLGSVEYEFEAFGRSTLGLRFSPLFYYYEEEDPGGGEGSIYGAAAGFRYRLYSHAEGRNGFFLELGLSALGQTAQFEGNSSHVNFISEGGIGYQFGGVPWNVGLRYAHISNAALGDHNQQVEGVLLSLGYRF